MEAIKDNRQKAERIAEILKNNGFKSQYQPAWETMARAAMNQKTREIPKMPSFREMGIKGQCAKAIVEAHDGAKAMKAKEERLGRLLGMSYLLMTEAIQLIDESELMMDRELRMDLGFKVVLNKINLAFDEYCKKMKEHISAEKMVEFCEDIKAFDANVREYAHLEGYKSATESDIKEAMILRIKNLHKEITNKGTEFKDRFGKDELTALFEEIKKEDLRETSDINRE